jgi:hypothetical protein
LYPIDSNIEVPGKPDTVIYRGNDMSSQELMILRGGYWVK